MSAPADLRARSRAIGDQRGAALVGAIVLMCVLVGLAAILMVSLTSHVKVTAHSVHTSQAVNLAEAGITEALSRITQAHAPDDGNPKRVTQVFLASSGSQPALGTDSTSLPTGQPAGGWLSYSAAARSTDALTIAYRTNSARTQIYRYCPTANPRIQTAMGNRIFVITSTGRSGPDRSRIRTEVVKGGGTANFKGAVTNNEQYQVDGKTFACGYEHKAATPTWTSTTAGRNGGAGSCNGGGWEAGGSTLGIHAGNSVQETGGAGSWGTPTAYDDNEADFYAGPWEPLGTTSAAFYSMMGPRQNSLPASPLNGNTFVDNNSTVGDESWAETTGSYTGSGILYVDGNWSVNGDLVYRGLVYVGGQLQVQGRIWVLGAVVTKKGLQVSTTSTGSAVLYSPETINAALGGNASEFLTISWREIPN